MTSSEENSPPAGLPFAEASAPGRLDLLGGVVDYSGGTTLEWVLAERTRCRVERTADASVRVESRVDGNIRSVTVPRSFLEERKPSAYAAGLAEGDRWSLYVLGCLGLLRERFTAGVAETGLSIQVESRVPEGKGVSSSAALEVAVMAALVKLDGLPLGGVEFALLCQRVENEVVGAPCGVMDQISCAFGRAGHLLPITCQPAGFEEAVALPAHLEVFGIDCGKRHSVGASPYGRARTAAFMAKAFLERLLEQGDLLQSPDPAAALGAASGPGRPGPRLDYLANFDPRLWSVVEERLPAAMTGTAFTEAGLRLEDPLSRLEEEFPFPLRAAARHAIFGHHRVHAFIDALRGEIARPHARRRQALGAALLAAHGDYSEIGLGSEATDQLLARILKVEGILGGKITGGGSGGTVAFLAEKEKLDRGALRGALEAYRAASGLQPYHFTGTSDGALG